MDPTAPATPLHRTLVARPGTDVTVAAFGAMVTTVLQAAEIAASEGTSIEVVDLRSLSPIDYGPLLDSVRKTGRLVVAQEAQGGGSLGGEIAATVAEQCFYSLQAPVLRVSGYDVPFPRRSSRACTCPMPIACSKPSIAPCTTDPPSRRSPR